MQDKSIYKEHYLGETYRAGVAYLKVRSSENDRAPRHTGTHSLDAQRQIIAKAARAERTIIVAEFIEYGDHHHGFRPAFTSAVAFADEARVPDLYVVNERYLAWRPEDFSFLMEHLIKCDVALVPAYDRYRREE